MVDFVVTTDLDLKITGVNRAALILNGYEKSELIGKSVNVLMADGPFNQKGVNILRKNGFAANIDKINLSKDGSTTPVSMSMSVFKDDAGEDLGIVYVGRDITGRRRTELEREIITEVIQGVTTTSNLDELLLLIWVSISKLLYAENCFVALFDTETELLNMQFFVDRVDTVYPSGKLGNGLTALVYRTGRSYLLRREAIDEMNEKGELVTVGTTPAIWLGVPLRTPRGVIGVLAVQHYEDPGAYSDGDLSFMSTVGDQIALAIERKRAEELQRQNEKSFRDLFDEAPVAYHELDSDGRYTRINHTEEQLLGYTSDELKGRRPSEIIVEKTSRETTEAKLAGKVQLEAVEQTFIKKDGTFISVLNEDRLIYDSNGNITGIRSTLQDITARKKAEEQLHIYNEKLQRSNRELEDFAYVASHDLQEPLRKVQAFSDRLKSKYGDKLEGEGLDYLERMRGAGSRMQLLIQDLLTFSRVSTKAQPFAPVDLQKIAGEVLSDLEVKIEETGASVNVENLPTIDADSLQMRQLMQNLIGNALKFRQSDKTPVINIFSRPSAPNGNGSANKIEIVVQDNGIGFDEKYTDKIFAVFQRLHGRTEYEGSGVGLSICRKIAERHDGSTGLALL